MSTHMFDNYNQEQDIPDNMHCKHRPINLVIDTENVDPIIDEHNVVIGYKWDYGCTVNLHLTMNIEARVYKNSVISSIRGEIPNTTTQADLGARFYNLVDVRSWQLVSISKGYEWIEDNQVTFPSDGDMYVTFTPNMEGMQIYALFKDFRGDTILEKTYDEVNECIFNMSSTESAEFHKGLYDLFLYRKSIDDEEVVGRVPYKLLINKYIIQVK